MPSGQRLDLLITLTDNYGQLHLVQIHDPPLTLEREHRHVLHFGFRRSQAGTVESDFDLANAPALAFAARARDTQAILSMRGTILNVANVSLVKLPQNQLFSDASKAKVEIGDGDRTGISDAVNALMGSKPETRFRFIQDRSALAKDLDI